MAKKTVIYYYSGSGNSLSVARQVAGHLGNTDLISIYKLRDNAEVPAEYDRVGICTATWFVRPPRIVKEICEKLSIQRSQKVFIIATCGGYDGYVCIDLQAILQPKTNAPVQTFMLPMPPNHIVGFSPLPDWADKIYLNHEKKATFNWRLLGVDRDSVEGGFYTTDDCTKCGTCVKLCKNGNIQMTDDGPVWGHDCQQCMACIMWCPNKAIWHPNIPEKRRRYQHPDITLQDMVTSEFYSEDQTDEV